MSKRRAGIELANDLYELADSFSDVDGMEHYYLDAIRTNAQRVQEIVESVADNDIDDDTLDSLSDLLVRSHSRIEMWHRQDNIYDLDVACEMSIRAVAALGYEPPVVERHGDSESTRSIAAFLDRSRRDVEDMLKSFATQSARTEQQLDVLRRDTSSIIVDAQEATEELQAHRAKAETIAAHMDSLRKVVTETAVAGVYQNKADAEEQLANRWRMAFVSAILLTAGLAVYLLLSTSFDEVNAYRFFGKVALAAPFATFAAYASKQSAEHRFVQREIEHTAMQLTSLRPYLQDIATEKDRNRVVMRLADQIIGRPRRTARSGVPDE